MCIAVVHLSVSVHTGVGAEECILPPDLRLQSTGS